MIELGDQGAAHPQLSTKLGLPSHPSLINQRTLCRRRMKPVAGSPVKNPPQWLVSRRQGKTTTTACVPWMPASPTATPWGFASPDSDFEIAA